MLYRIEFGIAAFLLLVIFAIFLKIQYTNESKSNMLFRMLIIGLAVADAFDIITAITISYSSSVPVVLNYVLNGIYFFSSVVSGYILSEYIISILGLETNRIMRIVNRSILYIYLVLCITTYFTHWIIYFDENKNYCKGALYLTLYIVPLYYMFFSVFGVIGSRTKLSKKQLRAMMVATSFPVVGIIIQLFVLTNYLIEFYGIALSAIVMLFAMETPDYVKLQKTMDELEKSQAALKEALRVAENANMAKSRFLSNMSHDIRTPMNAIIGFTELARRSDGDFEQVKDYLDKIKVSGEHLLLLINDVLDMGRIESGKVTIEKAPCNIVNLADELASMLKTQVEAGQLSFVLDYSGVKNEWVMCDKLHLNQVLMNCASNSVKFTPAGGTVSLMINQDGNEYSFVVKDTGIGMSEEFLEHIFEPFERERTSTISKTEGTGLGMSIAKNLVDMMGGDFVVESTKDVGTTFTVALSLEKADINIQKSNLDELTLEEKAEKLAGKKFLLVDDNAANRLVAKGVFGFFNMSLEEATDGQVAVDRMKRSYPGEFDMILMDIQMPVMDGYEATDNIRAIDDELLANIPIVAMTANAFEEDKKLCEEHRMNGHISKPFKKEILIDTLYRIFYE